MQKIAILATSIIMLVLVISGCSGGGETTVPGKTDTQITITNPSTSLNGKPASELEKVIAKAEKLSSYTYESMITMTMSTAAESNKLISKTKSKVWFKNSGILMEMTTIEPASSKTIVFVYDGNGYIEWVKGEPTAARKTGTPTISAGDVELMDDYLGLGFASDLQNIIDGNPYVIDTETYNEADCLVVQYTNTGIQNTAWISKDTGLPVKIEMFTMGTTMTTEYTNIEIGNVTDSMVKLPDYVTIKAVNIAEGTDTISDILAKAKKVTAVKYDWKQKSTMGENTESQSGTDYVKGKKWLQDLNAIDPIVNVHVKNLYDLEASTWTITSTAPNIEPIIVTTKLYGQVPPGGAAYLLLAGNDLLKIYSETVTGTETLDGKKCTVIQYDSLMGGYKLWIWQEYGLIVRWEMTTNFSGGTDSLVKYEFTNFDFSDFPDSIFE